MSKLWILEENEIKSERRSSREALFTIGNGYFGCRGFFEEEQEGLLSLGGIYMAGIFGEGKYDAWRGRSRELVNTPNFLFLSIIVDGEQLLVEEGKTQNFYRCLNMKKGILYRSFFWISKSGKKILIEIERFTSQSNIHLAGQKLTITPVDCEIDLKLEAGINLNVTNLNAESCEPLPIQPGTKHLKTIQNLNNIIEVEVDGSSSIHIVEGQKMNATVSGKHLENENIAGQRFEQKVFANESFELSKLVCVYTTRDCQNPLQSVQNTLSNHSDYNQEKQEHISSWTEKWQTSDIQINGADNDQIAVRYNLFQLMQACPKDDPTLSIGARGLTGEMYEGCVFWDTEIFKLPYFIFSNPKDARNLLEFRYHCLPNSKIHAKDNWFKGAMYAWQASETGIEQTPRNVGAFYAIHIVADISYAIMQYLRATDDNSFLVDFGAEILIETARFWESRVHFNTTKKCYDLLAVRGPNEYDVIVNNNVYTNMMVQENLKGAMNAISYIELNDIDKWNTLSKKLEFDESETEKWQDIIENIVICYDEKTKLYEEDDMYVNRVPLDLKRAKPTARRIIDSTLPYEALPLYQVTKQADVLCLMNNLSWRFTEEQKKVAWDYYEPKTAHDSSLSYSSHSILAARIGLEKKAYEYFTKCAYLDINDIQLNTISGLHFANFGGTWQSVIYGFGGISIKDNTLIINPKLPEQWSSFVFNICFKGAVLKIEASNQNTRITLLQLGNSSIDISVNSKKALLSKLNEVIEF